MKQPVISNTLTILNNSIGHRSLVMVCVLIFISHIASAQANKKYIGIYKNEIGEKIEFRSDSTYHYTRRVHMSYYWSSGKWSAKNDTIFLKLIAASDTIKTTSTNNAQLYSKRAESNNQISKIQVRYDGSTTEAKQVQQYQLYPSKLFFSRDRIYNIAAGGIVVKGKVSSAFSGKMQSVVYKKE